MDKGNKANSRRRHLMTLMVSAAFLTSAAPAMLPVGQAMAQGARNHNFNIPSQPLNRALRALADQSGVQLAYETSVASGANAPAVRGAMTTEQALAALLSKSGLRYSFANANTVTILGVENASTGSIGADGSVVLDKIEITGDGQSPSGPGNGYVATRSVSGTKSDQPILETPQAISVVTRKQMDDQKAQTVSQALRYTPGVLAEATGVYSRTDTIFARGFQPDQYLDGLRLYGGYAAIDPWGLDRVEYVRGPASVLFGQISPGGLINLTSKRPTADPLHVVELQTGTNRRIQAAFDFSGPMNADGTLLYRLNGLGRYTGSQIDFSKDQRWLINPSFTWKPDEDTSFTFLGGYQHDPESGAFQQLPAAGTVLPNPYGRIARSLNVSDPSFDQDKNTLAHAGYEFEHRFNDTVKFSSNFRYAHTDRDTQFLYPDFLDPDMRTLNRFSQALSSQTNTLTADNRLQLDFDTGALKHTVLGGIDYQNLKLRGREGYGFDNIPTLDVFAPTYGVSVPVPAFGSDFRQTQQQFGLYAQDTIAIERLRLIGGIREDWARSRSHDEMAPDSSSSQSDSAFTYRLGALYLFDNGLAPYVSYSTSFQPQSGKDFYNNPFVPTTGQQAEIGVKFQPVGYDSFVTAAVYDLTQQNVLTADPDPAHPFQSVQTGEVKSRGIEIEAHGQITDELSLIGSYAYQHVEVTKDNRGLQGTTPVRVPQQTAALWANYDFHSGNLAGLSVSGGVRYVGQQFGNAMNTYKVPAFTLLDAGIAYDFGQASNSLKGLKGALNVSNLLDKKYVAACIYNDGGCYYGEGRTIYATLTAKW